MSWLELYRYSTSENSLPYDTTGIVKLLDDVELKRFERYKFDHSRWTFALARWLTKTCLSSHLDQPPETISFSYNENGKPYVDLGDGRAPIHFSISHTESMIVVCLSNHAIGVDIELLNRRGEPWKNPAAFLNEDIARVINSMPNDAEKQRAFAQYWTAMEACVKLHGSTLFSIKETFAKDLDPIRSYEQLFYDNNNYYFSDINDDHVLCVCTKKSPSKIVVKEFKNSQFNHDDALMNSLFSEPSVGK